MPSFRPGFGPDQMAAFLGAPLTISQDSSNTSRSTANFICTALRENGALPVDCLCMAVKNLIVYKRIS